MARHDRDVSVVQLGLGLLPDTAPAGAVPRGGVGGERGQRKKGADDAQGYTIKEV